MKIDFWDVEDTEQVSYTTKDEAIEAILDEDMDIDGVIEICGFKRREIDTEDYCEYFCEYILDKLDDEYGGEEGTEITKEMIEITKEYLEKIKSVYDVWQCEIVYRDKINVKDWIIKNKPHWLKEM